MKQDAQQVITQQFIDAIEGGMLEGKWVRPWQNTGEGFPTNALTGQTIQWHKCLHAFNCWGWSMGDL